MNLHSVGGPILAETLAARYQDYIAPTKSFLLEAMRDDLNDLDKGDFSDRQLLRWLNRAKLEIERLTRCYRETLQLTLDASQHTYSVAPLFEVFAATADKRKLDIVQFDDVRAPEVADWDAAPVGEPERLMAVTGSEARYHPTPDREYESIVRGYAISPALVADSDEVTTLPVGEAIGNLIVRAEGWALLSRRADPSRVPLGQALIAWSDARCAEAASLTYSQFEF